MAASLLEFAAVLKLIMVDSSTSGFTRDEGRSLLTSLIVPRPVAWISTVSSDKARRNLAPFSSLAPACNKPLLLSFSSGRKTNGARKDTAANILENGEFVVNFVGAALLDKIALSANEFDACVDEFEAVGVTAEPSREVSPPAVLEALASLECRLVRHLELGDDDCRVDLIIGAVVHAHVRQAAVPAGEPIGTFCGIAALGLDWYLVDGIARFLPQPQSGIGK